jgi:hypothetical protein
MPVFSTALTDWFDRAVLVNLDALFSRFCAFLEDSEHAWCLARLTNAFTDVCKTKHFASLGIVVFVYSVLLIF